MFIQANKQFQNISGKNDENPISICAQNMSLKLLDIKKCLMKMD